MLDAEQKKIALQELGGLSEEIYDGIVRDFVAQTRSQITQLESLLAAGDLNAAARICHAIKGSSGNLRIKAVYEIIRNMEEAARAGQSAGLDESAGRVQGLIEELGVQFGV
ncbi:MAG: Hpt domain-containing protein [Candidatus Omnitrophota bacterium]